MGNLSLMDRNLFTALDFDYKFLNIKYTDTGPLN
jgi:hypothetical protein